MRIRSSRLASLAQRLRPAGLVRPPEAAPPGAAGGLFVVFGWQFLPFGSVQDNIKTFRWPLEISAHLEKGWKYCSKVRVALRERLGDFSRGLV